MIEKICVQCSTGFASSSPAAKYCSDRCRAAAYHARFRDRNNGRSYWQVRSECVGLIGPVAVCEHCGVNPSRRSRFAFHRFCSKRCQARSWLDRYEAESGIKYHTEYSRDRRALADA